MPGTLHCIFRPPLQCESINFIHLRFSGNISATSENFSMKFYTPTACSYLCKVTQGVKIFLADTVDDLLTV